MCDNLSEQYARELRGNMRGNLDEDISGNECKRMMKTEMCWEINVRREI